MWSEHWYTYISYCWHMPLNKYTCHILHIHTNAFYCSLYIDPTLHISKKKLLLLYTMLLSYMCQEQMYPLNATYASYFMYTYETTMSVYIHHMNSLQPIMWPKALVYINFTLLAYVPEQICLLHCTYMSHCISTVVYIETPHYCTHPSKTIKCNIYFSYYCKICAGNKYAHQMLKYIAYVKISWCTSMGKYANIYGTYDLTGINHVTRNTVHRCQWCWCSMMTMP